MGRIVVDSLGEFDEIASLGIRARLLIRLTPGVEAHTHEYVQTGQEDSKFGLGIFDGTGAEAIKRGLQVDGCELVGVHIHIGSQIFELAAFELAVDRIAGFLVDMRAEHGFEARELNVGGGLGVAHTHDESTPDPTEAAGRILEMVEREFGRRTLPVPEVIFEPGRALVGSSCVTLYRVGTVKRIPGVRSYVSVDGGMSDNIRPALYGARYEAVLANRMDAPVGPSVTVAGRHCEPDLLIHDVRLPDDVGAGDLLCVPATGAYTYSIASNYNRFPRPAVVMVDGGVATEIIGRETATDLLRLDRFLDGSAPSSAVTFPPLRS